MLLTILRTCRIASFFSFFPRCQSIHKHFGIFRSRSKNPLPNPFIYIKFITFMIPYHSILPHLIKSAVPKRKEIKTPKISHNPPPSAHTQHPSSLKLPLLLIRNSALQITPREKKCGKQKKKCGRNFIIWMLLIRKGRFPPYETNCLAFS